ncbi:CBS domain-containing protein [Halobaculum sp. MBLA0143]|uniref:CBS domain-containing protein n=1 Tax=Halobaculum sp. MBLA0143 TaxID=3079933 RepID=UPI003525EBC4
MSNPVSEYQTTPVLTVEPDEPLSEAVRAMDAKQIHSLVVVTDDCLAEGVFTSTDLLRAVADDTALEAATVGDYMTADVVTVAPDDDIHEVAAVMEDHDIGHVPVVSDSVEGIVTESDLRQFLAS